MMMTRLKLVGSKNSHCIESSLLLVTVGKIEVGQYDNIW